MQLKRHKTELNKRVHVMTRLAQIFLVIIAAGYWTVQVANGDHYRQLADHNRLRKLALEPPRGQIEDRRGRPLVENIPSYTLLLDRSRSDDLESSIDLASGILNEPPADIASRIDQFMRVPRFRPVPVAERLSLEQLSQFAVHGYEHPEFEAQVDQLRLYRYAHQTAHVLGYLGEVTESDIERSSSQLANLHHRSVRAGDPIGKKGIERFYEYRLRGMSGEQVVVVDSRGRTIDELDREAATEGTSIRLSLDLELQQEAARLLEGQVGSIVALDPRNGEVLVMVSSPSFDPNLFSRGLRSEDWRQLIGDPHNPLQNRAIQNTYPPGSVFKMVMAAASLEEHTVDPHQKVFCRGFSMIYNHRYRCHKAAGHGWVDLRDALKYSCNVYFHHLGQQMGIETIADYSRRFGLGSPTGVDLDGEKAGLVPDQEWSQRRRGHAWYPGETISVAKGQGPLLVTPLQIAVMTAAVANGGRLVEPRLLREAPVRSTDIDVSPQSLERIREALWAVVNEKKGTGRTVAIDGFEIAGKTGTAQVVRQETWTKNKDLAAERRDHAWFASYAPADDPQLVVVIFVEHGGGGSQAAAPLAKALYEKYLASDLATDAS